MNTYLHQQSSKAMLKRIDTIINELQQLRNAILSPTSESLMSDFLSLPLLFILSNYFTETKTPNDNLTQDLFGSLGKGSWDEYTSDIEWERFQL